MLGNATKVYQGHQCAEHKSFHQGFHFPPQVAETCQLAVRRLEWLQCSDKLAEEAQTDRNPYCSVDPAPPAARRDVTELRSSLLDEALPLFDRYRAMFALRNMGSEEAVLALGDGELTIVCFGVFMSASLDCTRYNRYSTAQEEDATPLREKAQVQGTRFF